MEKGGDSSSVLGKKSSSVGSMKSGQVFHHLGPPFDDGGANEVLGLPDIFSSSLANKTPPPPNFQSFNIFPPSYKSPGGGMGFPFTASQWKELERQAMIYKCMISSVPVPPYLLLPLSTNFSATDSCVSSSVYSGRYSKNGDPEPGRCKRTDGKKWRCAKEVAPQQKYCERHLHRGRPRSRKPVEAKNNGQDTHKKTRLQHAKSQPPLNHPLLLLDAKTDLTIGMEQPWENLMEPNMGLANCYFPQDYMENVFSYPNFPTPEIDNGIANIKPSMSLNEGDLSPSLNLSMAMAAGNYVKDCPVSWGGGPLGEALQPGSMAAGGSNPASPSGVLHWTLFSHSDSSVCNSPTLVPPPSEASNQWQN